MRPFLYECFRYLPLNYDLHKQRDLIFLGVEASFTLIDFILFFFSFVLGFVFALFFLIFALAVLLKIFSRYEFLFDRDEYSIIKYYRFFRYFRIRMRTIGFGEVEEILLSNHSSGQALFSKGMEQKEWFSLDIKTSNEYIKVIKTEEDELDEIYELYNEMEDMLDLYFNFRIEFVESESKE